MALFKRKKKDAPEAAEGEEKEGEEKAAESKEPAEGEAPAEGAEGAEGESPKKSKKKKLIILGGAVVAVLILGGAGAYFGGFLGGHDKEEGEEQLAEGAGQPVYFEMPQMLVNLNTGTKQVSFIKTTVTLELSDPKEVEAVQANLPRLLDSYNTFLREMRATDLYGSAGAYRLREELLNRANKILAPIKVKDVLFKELIVQ